VLAYLLANGYRGKIKLIYIDPPFDSGADYVRKVNLRGGTISLDGEGYSLVCGAKRAIEGKKPV
jgi:16S rRNA G966 N2-methylase RsmD